ncbi:FkbM family methyltransferase [Mesorhizobium sp. CAU 1741]|uniref:FkbM family methyltransferase n=1 Tax=Mesorhizobium sp. CAU 1741 TaxID=3140366 RepID=UPI00325BFBC6
MLDRVTKFLRLLRHPLYRKGLRHGIAAAIEHEQALRRLSIASIIDVGANKGQFALLARALFPEAIIHAFEPIDEEAARLASFFDGDRALTLHRLALGEDTGSATINISARADSSSMLPITPLQERIFPGTALIARRTIAMARGDDVLRDTDFERPLMIKLDVQGYELCALRGLRDTLAEADFVQVEVSFVALYQGQPLADEVVAFLRLHRFRLADIYNLKSGPKGTAIQADMLFERMPAWN